MGGNIHGVWKKKFYHGIRPFRVGRGDAHGIWKKKIIMGHKRGCFWGSPYIGRREGARGGDKGREGVEGARGGERWREGARGGERGREEVEGGERGARGEDGARYATVTSDVKQNQKAKCHQVPYLGKT